MRRRKRRIDRRRSIETQQAHGAPHTRSVRTVCFPPTVPSLVIVALVSAPVFILWHSHLISSDRKALYVKCQVKVKLVHWCSPQEVLAYILDIISD